MNEVQSQKKKRNTKITEEIGEIVIRKEIEKIKIIKNLFFEKPNNTDKKLAMLT